MENRFSDTIMQLRYSWDIPQGKETWGQIVDRVIDNVYSISSLPKDIKDATKEIIKRKKFIPGGRFLAQAGRPYHQTSNCFLLRCEDSREGWGDLAHKSMVMLMSGGGIGVDYSQLRPKNSPLKRNGGVSSGVIPLAKIINEIGRGVMSGGKRRSAIYGSLRWDHDDIFDFIDAKDWDKDTRKIKETNFDFPAPLDMTNISVILNKDFFDSYKNIKSSKHELAIKVYSKVIKNMVKKSEPGFQIDYNNPNESLRNACSEIVSEDDSDVCVLGSINFANIRDIQELEIVTELATLFLLLGTEYTDRPTPKVKEIQIKNRRLGLGIMGLHEWLIIRNKKYGRDPELARWLSSWKNKSTEASIKWSKKLHFNTPIATRAVAPSGSISIIGETTSGIEPIFAVAYKRRFLSPEGWKYQYVIDPVAERLIENGIKPEKIEDAYTLSLDPERRIDFQCFIQEYVDNAISSTINLPAYGQNSNNNYEQFGKMLFNHLPRLRGLTCFADGSRGGGQPLSVVDYEYAIKHKNKVFESNEECANGICAL